MVIKTTKLSAIFLGIVALMVITAPISSYAAFYPFGGVVSTFKPCPCSFNYWITIAGVKGGSFIWNPSTVLFSKYMPFPGKYVLGKSLTAPQPCLQPSPSGCFPIGFGFPILMMGTN